VHTPAFIRPALWPVVIVAVLFAAGGIVRFDTPAPAATRVHRHLYATHPEAARAVSAPTVLGPRPPSLVSPVSATTPGNWVATWGAAPQAATPSSRAALGFDDQTIREIVDTSVGGSMVRIRLANTFGAGPLTIGRAAIGVERSGARLVVGSIRPLTFAGRSRVVIPAGAQAVSDPVALAVAPLMRLAVSVFLPEPTGPATQHYQARRVNYIATGADAVDPWAGAFSAQTTSWYFLDGIDVLAPARVRGAIVALGDSITDGVGSPINADARWPNDLARRLAARPGPTLSVIDEGIGGNRVLNDSACCGTSAVGRFDDDVRDQTGVRDVILLEGINDIGDSRSTNPLTAPHTDVSALQIVDGYEQIIAAAHAAGLRIFGATLTPFEGARYWTPAGEAKREAVNRWILTSGAFDGVIDFARAVADPADPERLDPADDSGDHLHPDAAGYQAMAGAIDLGMLLRQR
jgi:lysophospholipase L1-like esterase